jgi:hypothetical protein
VREGLQWKSFFKRIRQSDSEGKSLLKKIEAKSLTLGARHKKNPDHKPGLQLFVLEVDAENIRSHLGRFGVMSVTHFDGMEMPNAENAFWRCELEAHSEEVAVKLRQVVVAGVKFLSIVVQAITFEIFDAALGIIPIKRTQ